MSQLFSTKGRYALRFMVDLAMHPGWVSLGDVSQRQDISRKYLEQVSSVLVKAGFLQSRRGKTGGYQLARKPEEYTLKEILEVADGSISPVDCTGCSQDQDCPHAADCHTRPVWQDLGEITETYLASRTLADLIGA